MEAKKRKLDISSTDPSPSSSFLNTRLSADDVNYLSQKHALRKKTKTKHGKDALNVYQGIDQSFPSGRTSESSEELEGVDESIGKELIQSVRSFKDVHAIVEGKEHRDIYVSHIVDHMVELRNVILQNNRVLSTAAANKEEVSDEVLEHCRDQGFSRPTVLILCPFKKDAYDIIHRFISILSTGGKQPNVFHKVRFEKEFGHEGSVEFKESINEEHRELLTGNNDDSFRIGVTLSKRGLKLFEPFDKSDIILSSPLGLRMILDGESGNERHLISSIQITIVDAADIMLQQNWEHISLIFSHLHSQPTKISNDISRVRQIYLDGHGKYFSQLLLFTRYSHELFSALMFESSFSFRGLVVHERLSEGFLNEIEIPVCQDLHRIECTEAASQSENRFNYFKEKISTALLPHTCVVVPSYYDFVRVRNYFKRQEESFVACHEYASRKKIMRARDLFYHGQKSVLLVTERFHFFNRRKIKGIQQLIFYQLPSHPEFYTEFINMGTVSEEKMKIVMLYTRFDRIRLRNVFGIEMANRILSSPKNVLSLVAE